MTNQLLSAINLTENKGPQVILLIIICTVLSGFAVIRRLTLRRLKKATHNTSNFTVVGGIIGAWVISDLCVMGKATYIYYFKLSLRVQLKKTRR